MRHSAEWEMGWNLYLAANASNATYRITYPVPNTDPADKLTYTITRSYRADYLANAIGWASR